MLVTLFLEEYAFAVVDVDDCSYEEHNSHVAMFVPLLPTLYRKSMGNAAVDSGAVVSLQRV